MTNPDDELIALLRNWQPSFGALKLAADRLEELAVQLTAARTKLRWAANMIPCTDHEREILLAGSTEPTEQHTYGPEPMECPRDRPR